MVDRLALAKRRLQNRKGWQRLRGEELVGTVSVREATHGDTHGWHPHYHVLCLIRARSDEEAISLLDPLRDAWLDCLRKEGLTVPDTVALSWELRGAGLDVPLAALTPADCAAGIAKALQK